MTTQSAERSDFIRNLGRLYGIYTGGFLAFIVLIAVLEQVGVPNKILGYLFVFSRWRSTHHRRGDADGTGFGILCRRSARSGLYNGMATGCRRMSAASWSAWPARLFLFGYDGIAWVLGSTGGFVLVSILVGLYLRKSAPIPCRISCRSGSRQLHALPRGHRAGVLLTSPT